MPSNFDPIKDAANRKKHGLSLAEGDGVLNDPLALTIEDSSAQGEQRFISVGMNVFGQLRVVVYSTARRQRTNHLRAQGRAKGNPGI